jgi:hypothetical protein
MLAKQTLLLPEPRWQPETHSFICPRYPLYFSLHLPLPSPLSEPHNRPVGRLAAYKVVFIGFLLHHRASGTFPLGNVAFEEINTYFAPHVLVGGGLIKIVI